VAQTLEQQRAEFAWNACIEYSQKHRDFDDFKNAAKAAPALIMSNGLMPAAAFLQSRGKDPQTELVKFIVQWLAQRKILDIPPGSDRYQTAMQLLMHSSPSQYRHATAETLAMLKWLRQLADAHSAELS
jgi:CRISPR-associated protein Cmr5